MLVCFISYKQSESCDRYLGTGTLGPRAVGRPALVFPVYRRSKRDQRSTLLQAGYRLSGIAATQRRALWIARRIVHRVGSGEPSHPIKKKENGKDGGDPRSRDWSRRVLTLYCDFSLQLAIAKTRLKPHSHQRYPCTKIDGKRQKNKGTTARTICRSPDLVFLRSCSTYLLLSAVLLW